LFAAADFVNGLRGVSDDMEFIEGDAGVGQVFGHAFDESLGHIDTNAGDLFLKDPLIFYLLKINDLGGD
jgi:hypothetical protein